MWNGGNDDYEVKNGDGGRLKPGQSFDAGNSPPHLTALLEQKGLGDLSALDVLIPGCGRGYDVASFVQYGANSATGLELAPTAVEEASKEVQKRLGELGARAKVVAGDFFESPEVPKYDVGYDYTFFCAIHPTMRDGWAESWSKHIKKGGFLVTAIFPVVDDRDGTGPPWPVWPELYQEKLEKVGFTLRSLEKVPESQSHPGREGKEWLAVWDLSS